MGGPDGTVDVRAVPGGRETRRLTGPQGPLSHIAYSTDGKRLAAAGRDSTVIVWDLATGKQLHRRRHRGGSDDTLWRLAFAAGDRLLVCGGEATRVCGRWLPEVVRCCELGTGKVVSEGAGPGDAVNFAAFSPDGHALVFGGPEALSVWQVSPPRPLHTVRRTDPGFLTFALSPDGRRVASASWDGTVRFWDAKTLKEVASWHGAGCRVTALAFAPDGRRLASAEDGVIRVWDAASGKRLDPIAGQTSGVAQVAFARQGRLLVSVAGEKVRLSDPRTGETVRELSDEGTVGGPVAMSPDGNLLASGREGVSVWELGSGRLVDRLRMPQHWVVALGFAGPGRLTLAGGAFTELAGAQTWVAQRDIRAAKEVFRSSDYDGTLSSGRGLAYRALSPDGKVLASSDFVSGSVSGFSAPVLLWDPTRMRRLLQLGGEDTGAWAVAFSPSGRVLATEDTDGRMQVWEVLSGKERRRFPRHKVARYVRCLAFSPDGRVVAAGYPDGGIGLRDVATGEELPGLPGHERAVVSLAFSSDGRRLASGSEDGTVLVWDTAGLTRRAVPQMARGKRPSALWDDLAGADAEAADRAVWGLAAAPDAAMRLLAGSLRPAAPADARVRHCLADLGAEDFAVRARATRELRVLGELARPALEEVFATSQDPEVRGRAKELLGAGPSPSAEHLRELRALEVLERIGTGEARALLESLAKGASGARLTEEAKAALERLARHPAAPP